MRFFLFNLIFFAANQAVAELPLLININVEGGWDPVMVFDNKSLISTIDTDQSTEIKSGKLSWMSHSSRPTVDTFMNAEANQITIVNGIYVKGINHIDTLATIASTKQASSGNHTDFTTWYAAQALPRGAFPHLIIDAPNLPGDLTGMSYSLKLNDIKRWKSENISLPDAYKKWISFNFETVIAGRTSKNFDSKKLESLSLNQSRLNSYRSFFVAQYDQNISPFKNRIKIGLEAIKKGYSQAVTLRHGLENEWDTRDGSFDHFSTQGNLFNTLFSDLSWLIAQLETQGIADNTVIVVRSNLGKNPKKDSLGGKNPWPYTSLLVWSKLWPAGRVIGSTDDLLMAKAIDPIFGNEATKDATHLTTENIYAAIFTKFKLPSASIFDKVKPAQMLFIEQSK